MPLQAKIDTLLADVRGKIPPPVFAQLEAVLHRLETARVGADAPRAGQPAPDVTFLDGAGRPVPLRDLHAAGPAVLLFYRGGWCPFCDLTLRAYEAVHERIQAAGARLVAVSPQTPEHSVHSGQSRALSFELLSDPHNAAARAFGLAWTLTEAERDLYRAFQSDLARFNGDENWELPAPAAFILDRRGTVTWSAVRADYTRRPEPDEVLAALTAGR